MIHRTKKKKGSFLQIDKNIISDNEISLKAKMVLIYMLSFPDDWKFNKTKIKKDLNIGNQSLESILLELRNTGYLVMKQTQSGGGYVWEYQVYEEKLATPIPCFSMHGKSIHGEPIDGNPMHGKVPQYINNDNTNNNLTNNNITDNEVNYKDIDNYTGKPVNSCDLQFSVFEKYLVLYDERFGKKHPYLKNDVVLQSTIKSISVDKNLSLQDWEAMIKYYLWHSKFNIDVDYNMNHFLSDGIMNCLINDLDDIRNVIDD